MTDYFEGHTPRECGEHRTVGEHRAWCYDCSEWCYPSSPCARCELAQHHANGKRMRRFTLRRHTDVSGISGTGDVADGVEFKDGICVVHWYGEDPSTVVWPTFGSVQRIHGHNGNTEIVWHDTP